MRDKEGLKKHDGCKMCDTLIVLERRLSTIEKLLEIAIDEVKKEDGDKQ